MISRKDFRKFLACEKKTPLVILFLKTVKKNLKFGLTRSFKIQDNVSVRWVKNADPLLYFQMREKILY